MDIANAIADVVSKNSVLGRLGAKKPGSAFFLQSLSRRYIQPNLI
ncbi:hypothetical protein [Methylomonas albis]|nr:hypothetical protein [Methylomonas albis]